MASSSSLSLSFPSSYLSRNWAHDVFPSFHGPDVRTTFLSHMLKEFRNKGIDTFIDNEINRGKSIGPELKRAIRESKIAVVLLSNKYASSSWCLDELVEIMNKESGQTVITIFYKINPTDVKKQIGDFGKVFEETCEGKTKEKIEMWRKALEGVATIAGYHTINWVDEAAMIEEIATHISTKLNIATPSRDLDRFIGMGAHVERLESLLRLDLDDVRMIGIWGPPGIGKSTITRILFNQFSSSFQLSAIMVNIKRSYPRPCLDEGSAQLQLQNQMLSQMLNHKDMVITHLGVAQERLKGKKVFLVLDDVDRLAQLVALAERKQWFGLGSRIVITTQDQRVLKAHGINDIYKVDFPTTNEALQMFCMYAFGQKYPTDGFTELAWEATQLAGKLPLGLKVMGSHFRGMSKDEWTKTLPGLRRLDSEIEGILKFSYDALDDENKDIFLHIACFFNYEEVENVVEYLEKRFPDVRQRLVVLYDKSLISMEGRMVIMHDLLAQLGRNIDLKKSGQRQFLEDIHEELTDDATGRRSVIGIDIFLELHDKLDINERAFEGMSNLQFLKVRVRRSHGLSYLSPKIRLLDWFYFPMTCLPSPVNVEFLVELNMSNSKLEKLWDGNKSLRNLKRMNLSFSNNLKELPNLSTAISLKELLLQGCSSLVKLPSSIGNATNLQKLDLSFCSSLVNLPSSIGNATNLQQLHLRNCSSLVKLPSSIGNAINLQELHLRSCSSLVKLPSSIGNATNLQKLDLDGCSSLVELPFSIEKFITNAQVYLELTRFPSLRRIPSFIGNAVNLTGLDVSGCSSLVVVPTSIGNLHKLELFILKGCSKLEVLPVNVNLKSLKRLDLSGCSSLKKFPEISTNISYLDLSGTAIEEVPSSIRTWYRLDYLILYGCKKLLSLPQLPESLSYLNGVNCESLETLDCSLSNLGIHLDFANCFKLNKDARDLIIQTSRCHFTQILPGKEIPIFFTHRGNGGSLMLNLCKRLFPATLKFKACVLLGIKNDIEDSNNENGVDDSDEENDIEDGDEENKVEDIDGEEGLYLEINDKQNSCKFPCRLDSHSLCSSITEHLYMFEFETDVASHELFFKFSIHCGKWVIKECGVNYGDCEVEEINEGHDSAETKKRKMDETVWVVIDNISKYTSNSEAGCSKSKVIEVGCDVEKSFKAIHEHDMVQIVNALHPSEISEVGIIRDCEAEEEVNGNDSAETNKRKKQSSFMFVDTKRTSEVGNNGDCEADKEVNEDDSAKTKKRRVSF